MSDRRAIESINAVAAGNSGTYVSTDLGIKKGDDETNNVISSTFGVIKSSMEAFWYATGLDPNVNHAYEQTMSDPNMCMEIRGQKFYPHPGVGNMRAYNELGNPSAGCFTIHLMG